LLIKQRTAGFGGGGSNWPCHVPHNLPLLSLTHSTVATDIKNVKKKQPMHAGAKAKEKAAERA